MGFFGQIIPEGEVLEVPVPEDYYLHLHQVCVAPETLEKKKVPGPVFIYAQTANEEQEYVVAVLNPAQHVYSSTLTLEFGTEDSPVQLRSSAGAVHLTGKWTWDENEEDECGDDGECEMSGDEEEDEEEEEDESEEDEEEAPMLVEIESEDDSKKKQAVEEKKVEEKAAKKKAAPTEPAKTTSTEEPTQKKRRVEEQPAAKSREAPVAASSSSALKQWRVYPDSDDGVPVPEPKLIKKGDGLEITDYIIGTGPVPKGGAVVKILYEGLFPDGTVFDQKVKRKSPFSFRKGTGQVIPGMDKGMEGMRVGGAREIVIPPELGYGSKRVGDIPANQTLIFRIRLVA